MHNAFHHLGPLPILPPQPQLPPSSKVFYSYVPNAVKTRKRTSAHQLSILEDIFVTDKKPNSTKRKDLSGKLNMTPREVQVWFQNRRAKEKKLAGQRTQNASPSGEGSAAGAAQESGSEQGSPSPDDALGRTTDAVAATSISISTSSSSSSVLPSELSPTGSDIGPKDPSPRSHSRPARPTITPSAWTRNHLSSAMPASASRISPAPLYEQRRSSLPAPSLLNSLPPNHNPFPAHMSVAQPSLDYHRRSINALDQHSCASFARRASLADPRVNHRYHPWAGAAAQRPSAPDIFFSQPRLHHPQPSPVHDFSLQQQSPATPATPFDGWTNADPFGTGATAATDGQHMNVFGGEGQGITPGPLSSYEFPPKDHQRQSVGSIASVPYSDASTSTSTGGPYFSDMPSEDGDGRRGSCVSTSGMLSTLSVGEEYRAARGSDFNGSDTNTISYPSPPSDRGRSASVPTLPHVQTMPPPPMERSVSYSLGADELASYTMQTAPPAVDFRMAPSGASGHGPPVPDPRQFKYGDAVTTYPTEYTPAASYNYDRYGPAAPQSTFGGQVFEGHPQHDYDTGPLQRFA